MSANTREPLAPRTLHHRLAALALVLGAVAVFGDPGGGPIVILDTRELAVIVESEVDHVTADELADWILKGRADYRLIDLRDAGPYAEYHIPTAENVPITDLSDYPLFRNEKIVLYSGGGIHSAQAWFLLRARGYSGVYILLGGLASWQEDVLFPALPAPDDPESRASFARIAEVSRYFGGTPQTGEPAAGEAPARVLPKVEMPANAPVVVRKKKHKEGC